MALAGTVGLQGVTSSNSISEQVRSLIVQKQFDVLYRLIKNCWKTSYAQEIYQELFASWLPRSWLAFLQNPRLNIILEPNHLIKIISKANAAICNDKLAENYKKNYHLVLVAIARNSKWCRMLSYRFFLDFVSSSKPLLVHVIFDIEFMTHLDYVHMSKLFDLIPEGEEQSIVLEYLEDLLDSKSPLYRWALETIKYTFIHCQALDKKLQASSCEAIISKLKAAFVQDKYFAVDVLKRPHLYGFFDLIPQHAQPHPLLDINDYKEIATHLRKEEPMLAYGYALQNPAPANQQDPLSLSLVEGMDVLSLSDSKGTRAAKDPQSEREPAKPAKKSRTTFRYD